MKIWEVYCESAENSTCFDMFLCIGALDCRGESLKTVAISNDFYMNFIMTDYFQDCHVSFHVTCWAFAADLKWCLFFNFFSHFVLNFFLNIVVRNSPLTRQVRGRCGPPSPAECACTSGHIFHQSAGQDRHIRWVPWHAVRGPSDPSHRCTVVQGWVSVWGLMERCPRHHKAPQSNGAFLTNKVQSITNEPCKQPSPLPRFSSRNVS